MENEELEKLEIKNNAIIHKDKSLNRLDLSFLKHIELEEYKTSNLLAYWINDFAVYHDSEKTFDCSKLKTFKRGNIIKVNLGFNIGNEEGGLHYCIVLNKSDSPKSGILNVIPLTSKKSNKIYPDSCVNLGKELYEILSTRIVEENYKLNQILKNIEGVDNIPKEIQTTINKQMRYMDKIGKVVGKMKQDSIALINQITTISKQRIYDDIVLRKVKLSNNSLNLIDDKIRELFIK